MKQNGDAYHTVTILDPTAQELIDVFLPPDGTQMSSTELKLRVTQLLAAARELDRLRRGLREGPENQP